MVAERHIAKGVKDPELRKKVTPDYTIGCKRILISNDYYPALSRPNVDVDTSGDRGDQARTGSSTPHGAEHEVDAIVYGTGFKVTDALEVPRITGVDGRNLAKEWATTACGHQGHHRVRLPEPVLPARPEHRARSQLASCS